MLSKHIRQLFIVVSGFALFASVDSPSSSSLPDPVVSCIDSPAVLKYNSSTPICSWDRLVTLEFPADPPAVLPAPHVLSPFDLFADFDIDAAEKWVPAWLAVAKTARCDPSRVLSSLVVEAAKALLHDFALQNRTKLGVGGKVDAAEHYFASLVIRLVLDVLFGSLGSVLVLIRKYLRKNPICAGARQIFSWAISQIQCALLVLAIRAVSHPPILQRCQDLTLASIILLLGEIQPRLFPRPLPPPPPNIILLPGEIQPCLFPRPLPPPPPKTILLVLGEISQRLFPRPLPPPPPNPMRRKRKGERVDWYLQIFNDPLYKYNPP